MLRGFSFKRIQHTASHTAHRSVSRSLLRLNKFALQSSGVGQDPLAFCSILISPDDVQQRVSDLA